MANNTSEIKRIIRLMRGGSQAQLAVCADGDFYVTKFVGNPQGTRTLVNEWIAQYLLRRVDVCTPDLRILSLAEDVRDRTEGLSFRLGEHKIPIKAGLHLGSRCPVDPTTTAIFDFLPGKLLSKVNNIGDFSKTLAVDVWSGQCDRRQAVFVRESNPSEKGLFKAYIIDNGLLFGGNTWKIPSHGRAPLYYDKSVYTVEVAKTMYEETVDRLSTISECEIRELVNQCPEEWLSEIDRTELDDFCRTLSQRSSKLLAEGRSSFEHLLKTGEPTSCPLDFFRLQTRQKLEQQGDGYNQHRLHKGVPFTINDVLACASDNDLAGIIQANTLLIRAIWPCKASLFHRL